MGTSSSEEPAKQGDTPLSNPAFRERLRDLPPSAKLVARTLHEDAPLVPTEIADRSLLPDRTVRNAVTRLEEAGLVEAQQGIRDARTQMYVLTSPGP